MKVAVIILNYNSADDCQKCVSFLKRQEGVELELVLVDNCSPDGDKVEALCREQECTFIASPKNRGYNAGNNIGLRYAAEKGYKYALIANPDMEFPQTDYVNRLVEVMSQDEEIAIVGSDIITPEGIHQNPKIRKNLNWRNSFDWVKLLFPKSKPHSNIPEWVINPQFSQFCTCLNGCCFLIRMSFLKGINFFDEDTFLYGEEPILGRQVELAGKKLFYTTTTYAIHNHKKNKEGNRSFCFTHWKHSKLIYISKYSHLNFFDKSIAKLSTHLYFLSLVIYNKLKK